MRPINAMTAELERIRATALRNLADHQSAIEAKDAIIRRQSEALLSIALIATTGSDIAEIADGALCGG